MTAVLESTVCDVVELPNRANAHLGLVDAGLRVPLADNTSCAYANFDYAASAPALRCVVDAVCAALPTYASVHRGAGLPSRLTTQRYEQARETVARFLGCADDQQVVFTRNTTDAVNLLAGCVPGDVVVLDIEHHATLLPWHQRRVVVARDNLDATFAALDEELRARPAALLAITGASNVTGEIVDIARAARLAHRHGARIFVDAAQLAPHRAIDVDRDDIDYLAISGHKLYAPFGAGALIGRSDWLDAADPYLAGGGASAAVTTDETTWHCGPARHEGGTPNVPGALALAAACEALESADREALERTERRLTERLVRGLHAINGVHPLRIWDGASAVGIVSFTVDGIAPGEVAEALSDRFGIGVRAGKFCAHPLLDRLGCSDGAVRASIGLGTDVADIDRLIGALRRVIASR
ncbi:aminotransferase class V-fold PLP-dependent enzyme [Millisia brevis]|uniref:aminotransferase class V-fold PLP-dependent enzyme n=1 Tax=Millisia brevis TaxID=264148 RepID=UPI00082B3E4C|nr:aminotransferase class V-fold PLP-dependent enzyme [Millisia brevis]